MTWLTVVGIGEDGIEGLGQPARRAIAEAEIVFGGARHLALASAIIRGDKRSWDSPFLRSIEAVRAERGRKVCVLASGDPMHFGVGATLVRRIDEREMHVIPAPSAFSLAASRMGWAIQDVVTQSLHGKSLDLIRPHLHPGTRILALTSDEQGPAALAQLLTEAGFGTSVLVVLEALGGEAERVRPARADHFNLERVNPLNLCAITVAASNGARILPLTPGRDDALFDHDGQITKREIRALTLSALAPRRGELLWDIGAGSGSIGIEWMLADPSLRAIAVEADPARAERIARNAAAFGVPGLEIISGTAPAAMAGLAQPDAIFIGGGGSEPGMMETAISALPQDGRLVANAVTLEMEAVLLDHFARLGGELVRIGVDRAAPVGTMTGWRPAMPVIQWRWSKQ